MNRNVESHFSELPKIDIERSIFDRSASHKTAFNTGELIPFYIDEVLPGDTFNVVTSCVVRLQTPLTPIMDNIYLDTYFFFVPNRLVWSHWKEFMGENTESAWLPQTEYTVPRMLPPSGGWSVGSIADYMGIPPLVDWTGYLNLIPQYYPSALPFRGLALICNEFFRDQNLTDPINISLGDSNETGVAYGTNYITDVAKGGAPFKVAKYHDYFSSCLPAPQRGPSVGLFPSSIDQTVNQSTWTKHFIPVMARNQKIPEFTNNYLYFSSSDSSKRRRSIIDYSQNPTGMYLLEEGSDTPVGTVSVAPDNLWADMSAANITINELRQAFQLQKFFEKNARSGNRYRELLKAHFGVTTSDARMQIPEYLGGHRFPLSIHQVANQSQGDSDFLGDLGAMSNTSDVHEDFVKSFEEHGYVFGLCCVRYDHSYPQGLERFWSRANKLDYYFPVFQNLGEQAVRKTEIFWDPTAIGQTFGYQEAYGDYRYKPSRVSSEMRPGVPNSLASWHLADYYQNAPSLSDEWIREDKGNIDRVLSVTSEDSKQVFADFYVKNICTRPMPMYSIPGLIDHH